MLLDRGLSLFAFVVDGNTTTLKLLRFYLSGYLYVLSVIAKEDVSKMLNVNTRHTVIQKWTDDQEFMNALHWGAAISDFCFVSEHHGEERMLLTLLKLNMV